MLPRMRTRDKCMEMIKQDDPETALTRSSLEYLIRSGRIPRVEIGNKILINYDLLLEHLAKGADEPTESLPDDEDLANVAAIRKIKI